MPNKDCLTLRNCPFCGGEAYMEQGAGLYYAICKHCFGSGAIVKTEKKAAEAWNRRVSDAKDA